MSNCKICGGWRSLGDDLLADLLRTETVAPDVCDRCLYEINLRAEVTRQAALSQQTVEQYLTDLKDIYSE